MMWVGSSYGVIVGDIRWTERRFSHDMRAYCMTIHSFRAATVGGWFS